MAMDLKAIQNFDINQLRSLDPKNMGSWPLPLRIVVLVVIYGVVLFFIYYLLISDQIDQRSKLVEKEASLKADFESKALQAANLDVYQKQLDDMQKSFGTMLKQLPGKTELPSILQDVAQAAQVDGLKQDLFRPAAEGVKDFYAETPIDLQLEGGYHEFGKFVSDVAALPRIVTLHNIVIKTFATSGNNGTDVLTMSLTAKTYRYLEEDEQTKAKPKTAKKPGGAG